MYFSSTFHPLSAARRFGFLHLRIFFPPGNSWFRMGNWMKLIHQRIRMVSSLQCFSVWHSNCSRDSYALGDQFAKVFGDAVGKSGAPNGGVFLGSQLPGLQLWPMATCFYHGRYNIFIYLYIYIGYNLYISLYFGSYCSSFSNSEIRTCPHILCFGRVDFSHHTKTWAEDYPLLLIRPMQGFKLITSLYFGHPSTKK